MHRSFVSIFRRITTTSTTRTGSVVEVDLSQAEKLAKTVDENLVTAAVNEFEANASGVGDRLKQFHLSLQQLEQRKQDELDKKCKMLRTMHSG